MIDKTQRQHALCSFFSIKTYIKHLVEVGSTGRVPGQVLIERVRATEHSMKRGHPAYIPRGDIRVERGRSVESALKTGDSADVPFREILIEADAAPETSHRSPLDVRHVPRTYFPIE